MRKHVSNTGELNRREKTSRDTSRRGSSVHRTLVGIRVEPRLAKVMKGVAELQECPLGELIERVFWHAIEGENAFAEDGKIPEELKQRIQSLKQAYGVSYDLDDLDNRKPEPPKPGE